MKYLALLLAIVGILACDPPNQLQKYYNPQDQELSTLIQLLKKNPTDAAALEALPIAYERAMNQKATLLSGQAYGGMSGERWESLMKEYQVAQQLNNDIRAVPAASNSIRNWYDFTSDINMARQKAAEAYYVQGLEYLSYNNRPYAQQALERFSKSNALIPGYKDVQRQMRIAEEMATITVVVQQVDYYRQNWNYWGYNNDYLQWRMINDLNARSYNNVRFFAEAEARGRGLHPDRVVDLDFTRIFVNNPYTERYSYNRSKQITNPNPSPRNSKIVDGDKITVRATVQVTKRLVTGEGLLQCRIYDVASGRNILFDNFPGRYQWVFETATYSGDRRALEPQDLQLINNRFTRYPSRNDVAQKIIDDSYFVLVNRINNGVSFY